MPVLFQINTTVNVGSHGRIAEEIAETAISQGWDSYIAYGRKMGKMQSSSNLIRIGGRWGIWWHVALTRLFDLHGLCSVRATRKLIKKIEAIKPGIIHLHNIHGYYLNYKILFGYLASTNIPVVWTLHDCWPFTGHCSYFDYIGCSKWKDECTMCPLTRDYPRSLFLDGSGRNYRVKKEKFGSIRNLTLVCVSHWLKSMTEESFLKKKNLLAIYNGIDTSCFYPYENTAKVKKKYGLEGKTVLLGVANVWTEIKGLKSYIALRERLPEQFVFVLVGLNRQQIRTLPQGIIGIGKIYNPGNLAELYSCADISLNLSVQEALGMTTIEALACGTPGIVYNITGCAELVTEETGVTVEKENIEALEDAVYQIIKKGKAAYKEACRKRAMTCFNKDIQYNQYMDLYKSLLP